MSDTEVLLTACPHCRRRYRVRSELIPAKGVRARCPHCGAVFPIVPSLGGLPASAAAAPGAGAPVRGSAPLSTAGTVEDPRKAPVGAESGARVAETVPASGERVSGEGGLMPAAGEWSKSLEQARPERGII